MILKNHRYMNQAAEGGEGGAPAPTHAPAAAGTPAPAPAAPASSLLQSGAAEPSGTDYIPEKLRVTKEDGTIDIEASSRKLSEAYGTLEKRLGSGDAPPAAVGDYKVAVPDAFKETIDPATDAGIQGFLTGAHAAGMNQAQVDFVMQQYFDMAPKLVAGAAQLDKAGATAELQKVWATEADFKRNVNNAYTGASAAAQKAGLDIDAIMSGPLGNDPTFVRLMAALGPEFQEDKAIGGAAQMVSDDDINKLLVSEAYTNPRHPEHAKVSAQIQKYYVRKHGTEAAA